MVTDEMVEKACLAYWGDKNMTSMFKGKTREGVESSMRAAIEAALSTDAEPVAWRGVGSDGVSEVTEREDISVQWREDGIEVTPLYAEPAKTAPAVAVKAKLIADLREMAESITYAEDPSRVMREAADALSAQVQDVAEKPLSLGALRNYFMALREADLSWSEMPTALYTYLLMDGYVSVKAAKEQIRSELSASPASKHGDAE